MAGPIKVTVGGCELVLSSHAVNRYGERVRPGLEFGQLIGELRRVLRDAEFGAEWPAWTSGGRPENARGWIRLTDDIGFAVRGKVIITCMDRTGVGAQVRVIRTERSREYRDRMSRPGHREKNGKVAREARRKRRDEKAGGFDG